MLQCDAQPAFNTCHQSVHPSVTLSINPSINVQSLPHTSFRLFFSIYHFICCLWCFISPSFHSSSSLNLSQERHETHSLPILLYCLMSSTVYDFLHHTHIFSWILCKKCKNVSSVCLCKIHCYSERVFCLWLHCSTDVLWLVFGVLQCSC